VHWQRETNNVETKPHKRRQSFLDGSSFHLAANRRAGKYSHYKEVTVADGGDCAFVARFQRKLQLL